MEGRYNAGEDQLQWTLSTGATYVDFMNSFVKFKVTMPAATEAKMADVKPKMSAGCGWAQMIKSVRIIHSSGTEIDRIKDSAGEFLQLSNYYNKSAAVRQTQCALYDLNDSHLPSDLLLPNQTIEHAKRGRNKAAALEVNAPGDYLPANAGATDMYTVGGDVSGKTFDVVIPLCDVSSFFAVDLLAPSFLAAGLQVHIDMYPPQHFFECESAWITGQKLEISRCEMHLETFTLSDSISRKLSQISASSGLEWYFDAVHQMNHSVTDSDLSMQITRVPLITVCVFVLTHHIV